jgi:hypothetical protein
MKNYTRLITIAICLLVIVCCLICCKKKEEGKLIVTEKEFNLRADGNVSYSLDAKGKIKNIGKVDVKNVVVTGYCRSCGQMVISGNWFVNDLEKRPEQKNTINYIKAGEEAAFSFQEIAYFYGKQGPQSNPEKLEIVIESFETVQ